MCCLLEIYPKVSRLQYRNVFLPSTPEDYSEKLGEHWSMQVIYVSNSAFKKQFIYL